MSWRTVQRRTGNALPRHLIFFDTETCPEENDTRPGRLLHPLRLGHCVAGRYEKGKLTRRKEFTFFSHKAFWKWVFDNTPKRGLTWIVAHNTWFDTRSTHFFDYFETGDLMLTHRSKQKGKDGAEQKPGPHDGLCVLECPPFIMLVKHLPTQRNILLVDSLNWFLVPLEEMGEWCGLPKGKLPPFEESDRVWIDYCRRDVEILEKVFCSLIRWIETNNMGAFQYTAAGQAMRAFRTGRMDHKIVTHDEMDVKEIERSGYFGGLNECFYVGKVKQEVHYLDVNSLYPSVMRSNEYPTKLIGWETREKLVPSMPDIDPNRSMATVQLCSKNELYPVRKEGYTIYARGNVVTTLAGPELARAVDHNLIWRWGSWATYETAPIFTRYVDDLWALRLKHRADNDPMFEAFCKLLLNGLYGKWGQKFPKWVVRWDLYAPEPFSHWTNLNLVSGKREVFRSIGWQVQQETGNEEKRNNFIAIAAFVTSYARNRMRDLIALAGHENVFYIATDGILVNRTGLARLDSMGELNDTWLGKLKFVRKSTEAEISGLGQYVMGDHEVMVGRKRSALMNPDGSWTQITFSKATSLFSPLYSNEIESWDQTKRPKQNYPKGIVQPSGWVSPFELDDGIASKPSAASSAS